jgi:hypothetical protein
MLEKKFIGTWKLIDWYLINSAGKKDYPFGQHPKGYLIYLPTGFMSAHLMAENRQPFADSSVFSATPEEALAALKTYASYCGKYSIEKNYVKHHIELVLNPGWVGTTQVREFEFQGDDRLVLRCKLEHDGEEKNAELFWQKQG